MKGFSVKRLRQIPLQLKILFRFLPSVFKRWAPLNNLSEYEKFMASGGDDFYYDSIYSNSQKGSKLAVVLGGFMGESAIQLERMGFRVVVFEPINDWANTIRENAKNRNLAIEVIQAAASNKDGFLKLGMSKDGTSEFREVGLGSVSVTSLNFAEWVLAHSERVSFLEMNIEGGEYVVLEELISSGAIDRIDSLAVQFHNLDPTHRVRRNEISSLLSTRYKAIYSFPWVWEFWGRD
jgi:FkbM family methyltransferase